MRSDPERLLRLRQMALRLRSAELRVQLANDALALRKPIALADRVYLGYLWLRERPHWLLGGAGGMAAVLALLKPRRLLRWTGSGLWAWRLLNRLVGPLKKT